MERSTDEGKSGSEVTHWKAGVVTGLMGTVLLLLPPSSLWLFPLLLLGWRLGRSTVAVAAGITGMMAIGAVVGLSLLNPEADFLAQTALDVGMLLFSGLLFLAGVLRRKSVSWSAALGVLPWVLLLGIGVAATTSLKLPVLEGVLSGLVLKPIEGVLNQTGGSGLETDAYVQAIIRENRIWLYYLTPGLKGFILAFTLWVNLWIARALAPGYEGVPPLREWRPPELWFAGLLLAALLVLVPVTFVRAVGLNLLLLGFGVYFLAGLAVLSFAVGRWRLPGWSLAVMLLLLAFSSAMPLLALLGAVDFWLDLRKRFPEEAAGDDL